MNSRPKKKKTMENVGTFCTNNETKIFDDVIDYLSTNDIGRLKRYFFARRKKNKRRKLFG